MSRESQPSWLLSKLWEELRAEDGDFYLELLWKAIPKGRPRVGKHSVYTPKRTREFEKRIREAASTVKRAPFTCPVHVDVTIWEVIPKSYVGVKRLSADLKLITPPVGDLDNKVKAITDALNGIAYLDDKQIASISASKQFAKENKITVIISRAGLSLTEAESVNRR